VYFIIHKAAVTFPSYYLLDYLKSSDGPLTLFEAIFLSCAISSGRDGYLLKDISYAFELHLHRAPNRCTVYLETCLFDNSSSVPIVPVSRVSRLQVTVERGRVV
jgi:hypothetical protein